MTEEEKIKFSNQEKEILSLRAALQEALLRISQLEALLKAEKDKSMKDSHNSSKLPSSDLFPKTKSLRTPSGKKPGGQPGHKGTTLEMSQNPDNIITHNVERCSHCHQLLTDSAEDHYEKRQVYDLPPLKMEVTE